MGDQTSDETYAVVGFVQTESHPDKRLTTIMAAFRRLAENTGA